MNRYHALICMLWAASMLVVSAQDARMLVHYTSQDGGFETVLSLWNSDFSADQTGLLRPFAIDGTPLTQVAREVRIPAGAKWLLSRADLGWDDQPVSHVVIEAPASLRATARYRALQPGAMPADVVIENRAVSVMRFSPVADAAWFDGIAAVNPNDAAVTVHIAAHDATGATLQTVAITLAPGAKWLAVLDGLFTIAPSSSGFVEVRAEQPVAFLVLRGSRGAVEQPVLTEVQPDAYLNEAAPLTFSNQISRILQRECTSCHHDGGIGPFRLTNFGDTAVMGDFIYDNVSKDLMPPWLPSADCLPLEDERRLDPAEKTMLLDWVQAGVPQGDPEREPDSQLFEDPQWKLGTPSQIAVYDTAYTLPEGPDQYVCFPVSLNNASEVTLGAIEILPGNLEIVHHVLVYADFTDQAHTLDSLETGPGYTCFGGTRTGTTFLLGGWAPGMEPLVFPNDVGMTLPPDTTIIFQVHYHHNHTTEPDQTQIGLYYDDQPRAKELVFLPLLEDDFLIPADEPAWEVTRSFTLPAFAEATIHMIAPHMHLLGKEISVQTSHPDHGDTCLIDIPRWDFEWQRFYRYPEPIHLKGGSTLSMRCIFDNSADNPRNPNNPPQPVTWGEATTDEMALTIIGVTSDLLSKTMGPAAQREWWMSLVEAAGDQP